MTWILIQFKVVVVLTNMDEKLNMSHDLTWPGIRCVIGR
jgi:hypothetical protein